ncbi:OsmC family protein [Bacillus kwashiorkori]|uniref:OsmC family protein n=1 Tax=Bacillus kwashiorkori TaxID=1522318 RepID=UPI000785DD9D|nr:OsmC family protein [Bacillus kwashiorkori]
MKYIMKENGFYTELPYGPLHISSTDEHGFRPYQLLVSSIAVCSGGVLRKVLEKMRLPFEDIQMETEVERNPEHANRIEGIQLHFIIKGNVDETKVQKALHVARKNCAMVQSVEGSINIVETFEVIK